MGAANVSYRRWILEMVLVTGLFAVISVFILKIYVTADRLQGEAVAISTATVKSESVLEYAAANGVSAAAEFFEMQAKDGGYVLCFDRQWQPIGFEAENIGNEGKYLIVLKEMKPQGAPVYVQVCAGTIGQEALLLSEEEPQNDGDENDFLCQFQTCVRGEGWSAGIQ